MICKFIKALLIGPWEDADKQVKDNLNKIFNNEKN